MAKKNVKVAYDTDGYDRVRQGKPEHVRKYEKEIDIPTIPAKDKEKIKQGKAKELIEKYDKSRICPICKKVNNSRDDEWSEFGSAYHVSCIKEQEKKGTPFHKNYQSQKRLKPKQVLEVLDLLQDKAFVEYWIEICCSEEDLDKLLTHPILLSRDNPEGIDLFP